MRQPQRRAVPARGHDGPRDLVHPEDRQDREAAEGRHRHQPQPQRRLQVLRPASQARDAEDRDGHQAEDAIDADRRHRLAAARRPRCDLVGPGGVGADACRQEAADK